jgi:hypothetical protein
VVAIPPSISLPTCRSRGGEESPFLFDVIRMVLGSCAGIGITGGRLDEGNHPRSVHHGRNLLAVGSFSSDYITRQPRWAPSKCRSHPSPCAYWYVVRHVLNLVVA